MREIKFRGKNKDIGWVCGQLAYDINGNAYIIQEVELDSSYGIEETILFATIWYRVEKETLGQYTGLKDKNGKEIYEGDIVKSFFVDTDEAGNEIYKYYIMEVKYDEILCSYKIDKFMNLEVIGNIYDNKELLNETNR